MGNTPVIPVLGRSNQDDGKFKVSLEYLGGGINGGTERERGGREKGRYTGKGERQEGGPLTQ